MWNTGPTGWKWNRWTFERFMDKTLKIGVTGGLASGKSTVSAMFAELGAKVIDADAVSHELLRGDPEVKRRIRDRFGEEVFREGEVDRERLRRKAFKSSECLRGLCSILHPGIIEKIKKEARASGDPVVIDAPLLIESGLNDFVDVVVLVAAPYGTRLKRAGMRGLSEAEAVRMMENQMSEEEKRGYADYIIDNSDDIEITKEGVRKIWQKM
ncbi:MAG: dephospho-CoA kinase [Candidatus Omnitrophica bacterium]|nr:dephospho-CoA kinase [Candidatus Omnitrophota bacterium]